jgi:hypothetical protein
VVDTIRSSDEWEADRRAAAARAEGNGENGADTSGGMSCLPVIGASADHSDHEAPPSPTSSESSWSTVEGPASEDGTDFLGDENAEMYANLLKDVDARNKSRSASPPTGPTTTKRTYSLTTLN